MTGRFLLTNCLALGLAALLPVLAEAGATRSGNSFNMGGSFQSKRTDVAYDPANDVYLAVSGDLSYPSRVYGRFVRGDGTLLGGNGFVIPVFGGHSAMPRVAYSADLGGFLVVWQDLRVSDKAAQIWARYLKFQADGSPLFVTGDFYVDDALGGAMSQSPPDVACASGKGECLVAWSQIGAAPDAPFDIHARRIDLAGNPLGTELNLTHDFDYEDEVSVTYEPASGNYMATWATFRETQMVAQAEVVPIAAGAGTMGQRRVIAQHGTTYVPQVETLPNGTVFATWYTRDGSTYYGRVLGPDGAPVGEPMPLLRNYGGYDAWGIAYNTISNTFFAVTHGRAVEDVGVEISSAGIPSPEFEVTGFGGRNGTYYPRIAASTAHAQWLISVSANFAMMGGQFVTTDRREPKPGGGGGEKPPSAIITLAGPELQNGSWLLAEGVANTAAQGYKTYYLISNPNLTEVPIRAYYAAENGYTVLKEKTLPARSRTTIALVNEVGQGTFGTVFQSLGAAGADIQVERSVYWGGMEGSTGASATKDAATRWMFAEGSRGGERFANYFLLFNPTQTPATVALTFFFADGSTFIYRPPNGIGAQQRLSIDANALPELAGRDFSTVIDATAPIVAERSMFWGWKGSQLWTGGTGSLGATVLNTRWYFAEGAAAIGYQTYYLVWNPNPTPISVSVNYHTEYQGTTTKTFQVAGHARRTLELNNPEEGVGNVGGVSAEFFSSSLFLVERSSYWGPGWVEGINVVGTPGVAREWFLPEGSTGGLFQNFLLLLNPHGQPVPINITVYLEGGGSYTAGRTLAASSRTTINMADFLAEVGAPAGSSFATRVGVLPDQPGIVAEHAIYWDYRPGSFWLGGSGSVGIPTGFQIVP